MQSKGIIKFFLIVLALVVLYQFLLMLPTRGVERRAAQHAALVSGTKDISDIAFKKSQQAFLDSVSDKPVLNIGIKKFTYQELKAQQLALGLDLKGGMSVIMQVDLEDLVVKLSNNNADPTFRKAIQQTREGQSASQDDFVTLFIKTYKQLSGGKTLAPLFALGDLKDKITLTTSDSEVERLIREQSDATVDRTYALLKKRIDKFGVTQPNVTLDQQTDRILVELPGVENPERARKFLQATAKLQFFEVYEFGEIQGGIMRANEALKVRFGNDGKLLSNAATTTNDTVATAKPAVSADTLKTATTANDTTPKPFSDVNKGPLLSLLQANGVSPDGRMLMYPAVVGVANATDTARINLMLNSREARTNFPADLKFLWAADPNKDESGNATNEYHLFSIRTERGGQAPLEGDRVANAMETSDPRTNETVVSMSMNQEGARDWARLTKKNLKRSVAIVLDDEVCSAPVVQSEMTDGNAQISGGFSVQEAQDLANILKIGKLPAKTLIIQEDVVGPTLGAKNINAGLRSMAISLSLLMIFMVLYYGRSGWISNLALAANLFFVVGALASWGTVLTLPGMAGILLTMTTMIDANIIIFERVREEMRLGKSLYQSIIDGFQGSYSAIIDANISNLLVAAILAYFGLGPIKGFAVVLIIGIICSVFTAVLVTRLIFEWWVGDKGKDVNFETNFSRNAFTGLHYDFVGKRRIAYIISGSVILLGIVSALTRGFDLGVDFKGGRAYTIQFPNTNSVDANAIRESLGKEFGGNKPLVKTFGGDNQVQVTTSYMVDSTGENVDAKMLAKLYSGVNAYAGGKIASMDEFTSKYLKSRVKVGATVADDISNSAYKATIWALIAIFFYILFRFRKWQFGLGAVLALVHDVLAVLACFSLLRGIMPFSMEIDQAFVAAILTVVGYSMNDTVVVFDRIREFFGMYTNKPIKETINMAINDTLSRTVITSATTFVTMLVLFLFGGEATRAFSFALLVGIFVGTYSSIFVATPIVVDLWGKDSTLPTTPTENTTSTAEQPAKA